MINGDSDDDGDDNVIVMLMVMVTTGITALWLDNKFHIKDNFRC
jgi:hypothetical protein